MERKGKDSRMSGAADGLLDRRDAFGETAACLLQFSKQSCQHTHGGRSFGD